MSWIIIPSPSELYSCQIYPILLSLWTHCPVLQRLLNVKYQTRVLFPLLWSCQFISQDFVSLSKHVLQWGEPHATPLAGVQLLTGCPQYISVSGGYLMLNPKHEYCRDKYPRMVLTSKFMNRYIRGLFKK